MDDLIKGRIKENLQAVYNSCYEGYDGVWDCSGEGRDGFMDMATLLQHVARDLEIELDDYNEPEGDEEELEEDKDG